MNYNGNKELIFLTSDCGLFIIYLYLCSKLFAWILI